MAIGRNKAQVPILLSIIFILVLQSGHPLAALEKENSSNSSVSWSIGRDTNDLRKGSESTESLEEDGDEFTGGFSTLDSMLQWAIGHSDPAKLKEKAEYTEKLSPEELLSKQSDIKELMEKLKMPSDAELMKIAIADLNNSSSSPQERLHALSELLVLVEPIDNAIVDMDKLGGLEAVIKELEDIESDIRTTSAWVLGKASQNNPLVQNQILGYGALTRLMKMVHSSYTEEAAKAFYAISALIRNNEIGQELFYLEGGTILLQDMLRNSSIDTRLQKKVVFLVADLADYQANLRSASGDNNSLVLSLLSNRFFLKSVVDLSVKPDLDLQEKVLMAVRSLLHLASTEARELKEFCSLDQVLETIRVQLEALTSDEDLADFARDVETLRREVQSLFHQKLEQVPFLVHLRLFLVRDSYRVDWCLLLSQHYITTNL
ncbi:hsp70 nucleotide exchange factor FES1 isoform X1 [Carex littledalei]|uniref:Hsp70 nucleotide exchange factor FES1 isoform X1 n=1 Tax=Carex littledalei TaxID=544730 RepID=A0A833QTA4_9POAL|nr:hsp70 nucleotide exchange factor FES1 isoform X1 [Carex littledalei]